MQPKPHHISGFNIIRRAGRALSFVAFVASIASAIGVVLAVLVLTTPTRIALTLAPLPAVAWEMTR